MPPVRARVLLVLFFILGGVAIYFLVDRTIAERDKFLSSRYTNRAVTELMERMIEENVFKIENGKIILDEKALTEKHLGGKIEKKVKESLPFLYVKAGRINFDTMAISIASHSFNKEESALRGRFLDRNGVVLAEGTVSPNEKLSKQKRQYTYGPEFYPVIGHSNFIYGKRNLEKEMDEYLSGKNHSPVYRRTSDFPVEVGDDIVLTIDSRIQRLAYHLMKDKRGAVVVLDVKTGEILGAVSTPSFDPNVKEWDKWRETFKDNDERPYENRAFSVCYPPGSTFKTVVGSAWIEEDNSEKAYEITCSGKRNKLNISDVHPHGRVAFNKAFLDSCNQFFGDIGVMLGQKLLDYANKFGFNRDVNLIPQMKNHQFRVEKSLAFSWHDYENGIQEIRTYKSIDFRRNPKIVAQGAIGQNLVGATPLQMALIASTIANKGVLLNPYIIKEIRTGNGKKVLLSSKPVELGRAIKDKTAEILKGLMVDVMERGTGKNVKKIYFENGKYTTYPGSKSNATVPVAGKTGTAEVGDKNGDGVIEPKEKPHSWFIGFAPAHNPKVAIAVVVENQGFGSLTAAPIAMDVMAEPLNQSIKDKIL